MFGFVKDYQGVRLFDCARIYWLVLLKYQAVLIAENLERIAQP